MEEAETLPQIAWIKNDPTKYSWFTDGSRFLVALQVTHNTTGVTRWDNDVVQWNCDGEGAYLQHPDCGCSYDAWFWDDFEYFALLAGEMPTTNQTE